MGKYERLSSFLRHQSMKEIPMTFNEIENIIGAPLPASARAHRAWWSNNPSNSVITREWLTAGFVSEQVDMAAERLVFRRRERGERSKEARKPIGARPRHPLFGSLKGMIRIAPGTDLTKPAEPEWGDGD